MKTYQKNIISEINNRIASKSLPRSSPEYRKLENIKSNVERDNIIAIPKYIINPALEKSRSAKTADAIQKFNRVNIVKEKVNYFLNKNNLRIIAKDRKGEDKIFEKKLQNKKYSLGQLVNMANNAMSKVNSIYANRYDDDLVAGTDLYIVERHY